MSWKTAEEYTEILQERLKRLDKVRANPSGAWHYYSDKPSEFIKHFAVTYDPRVKGDFPKTMPFVLFPIQEKFIHFLEDCRVSDECGLVEKSRDLGASWVACAYSVWLWIFKDGIAVGWGSRKEMLLDRIGDMSAIFPKMRVIIENIPKEFLPGGFNRQEHLPFMRLLNQETGASITGESGDGIGRGGRTAITFVDESAHLERAELVEASLGDNTRCQIDISSVNGSANVFYRKRMAGEIWEADHNIEPGITRVFIMDWSDHPEKTQEWYDRRRLKAEREGMLHVFAQEVDRDYSASVEGILIPAKWVKSAVGLELEDSGMVFGGLDVADEGGDKHALAIRKGPVLKGLYSWPLGDVGVAGRRAFAVCKENSVNELWYDSIGVGAGVKSEANIQDPKPKFDILPWCASAKVLYPKARIIPGDKDSPTNNDFYENLKSQGAWELRGRFRRTYRHVVHGEHYEPCDMISIPRDIPEREALITELSQPTYSHSRAGKIIIDKKPNGAKSPNLFDAVVQAFWPAKKKQRVLI